jgi:hypothetical protein
LRRSAPGHAISGVVLAALPVAPAASVGVGAAGKGMAAAKSGFLAGWLAPLAPLLGIFAGFASQLWLVRATTTGRERRAGITQVLLIFILLPAMMVAGEFAVQSLRQRYGWSDTTYYAARTGVWWLFAAGLSTLLVLKLRALQALHERCMETGEAPLSLKPGLRIMVTAGLSLTSFGWLISVAYEAHDSATAGIIAVIMGVMGVWDFLGVRRKRGAAAARAGAERLVVYGVVVLLTFNLRLDVWMTNTLGVSMAEVHALYPPWIIPSLSLALIAWIGLVWVRTAPPPPSPDRLVKPSAKFQN